MRKRMTLNMECALLLLSIIFVFGGISGVILDSISRHQLWMAGENATRTIYIKYEGHYLPYEEK